MENTLYLYLMTGSSKIMRTLATCAEKYPHKTFLIETSTNQSVSYANFFQLVQKARCLLGEKRKKILVILPGGILDSVLWIATLTSGHILIPASPYLTEDEYQQLFIKHAPDMTIATNEWNMPTALRVITADNFEQLVANQSQQNMLPVDGNVFLATSGSTGQPKGMLLSCSQLVLTAQAIQKSHKITAKDIGLTPLPFFHVNAPIVSLLTTLLSKATLVIAPKYSTHHFWEWVETYRPTWISLVPTMIAMLLTTEKPETVKNTSIRFIRTASAPLPVENLVRFEEKFHIPVIETYGISEAGSTICANPVPPGKHIPGSVGLPIGIFLKIVDVKSGKKLSKEHVGEVCIKGKNVISHYEEGRDKKAFKNGWFHTGDLGFVDKKGYVHLTGRIKDIIIRGGENISPREIEEVLIAFPKVSEAVVVGQPDSIYGEKIVGFVIVQEKVNAAFITNLFTFVRTKVSPQKVPSDIFIIPQFPRTKTGKVDKPTLRIFVQ